MTKLICPNCEHMISYHDTTSIISCSYCHCFEIEYFNNTIIYWCIKVHVDSVFYTVASNTNTITKDSTPEFFSICYDNKNLIDLSEYVQISSVENIKDEAVNLVKRFLGLAAFL